MEASFKKWNECLWAILIYSSLWCLLLSSVCVFFNSYGNVIPSLRDAIQNLNRMAAAVQSLPHIPAMLFFTAVGDHSSLIHQMGAEHMSRLCFSRVCKEVKATSVGTRWWHQFTLFLAVLSVQEQNPILLWSVFQGRFLGGEVAHCCVCWFPLSTEQWAAGICSSGVNQFPVNSLCWFLSQYY